MTKRKKEYEKKITKNKCADIKFNERFIKKHGFKRPKNCARIYMMGFNDAKKRYKKIKFKIYIVYINNIL